MFSESILSPLHFEHIVPSSPTPSPLHALHFGADASLPNLSAGRFLESWKKDLQSSISSSNGMSFAKDQPHQSPS